MADQYDVEHTAPMIFLAEISDKMPTAVSMWLCMGCFALVLAVFTAMHRTLAAIVWPLGVALSVCLVFGACHEAWWEAEFSQAVWSELGGAWVLTSILTACLPALAVTAAAVFRWRCDGATCRQP